MLHGTDDLCQLGELLFVNIHLQLGTRESFVTHGLHSSGSSIAEYTSFSIFKF